MRPAALAVTAAATLALASSAGATLRYSTVAKGSDGGTAPQRAYVALDAAAVERFTPRLRPEDRERVRAVDFRRFALVAAFVRLPTPCNPFAVRRVEQRGRTLLVAVAVGAGAREPCIQVIATGYHVVKIRRRALGAARPTRAVLRGVGRDGRYR
ncbi:MAG: hypothetical protein ICV64_09085 [Thermoleophilia bacterium]|nr:hypothetical protein [Thermoleophilia bacterium]